MTTATTPNEILLARLLPILRRCRIISEIELSRLVRADHRDVRRALAGHANVGTAKEPVTPLVFEWRE